jgi:hypothetical protein
MPQHSTPSSYRQNNWSLEIKGGFGGEVYKVKCLVIMVIITK